jgi:poly-beta-1,6-N-acetyl-D-glucosamine synthase
MWIGVFSVVFFIQISYFILLVMRLVTYRNDGFFREGANTLNAISIIIAAKNEAENLLKNLPLFLELNYPEFEVVVVLNDTNDRSQKILQEMESIYTNLVVCVLPIDHHGKKAALAFGVEKASHNNLVFSDADCRPQNDGWLMPFGAAFSNGVELVLGSGLFETESGLVNKLYRLESERIAMRYMLAAMISAPYMGVGRSMGYTKSLYEKVDGFIGHSEIASGDDDLFIQSIPNGTKTMAVPEALTMSKAPDSLVSWFGQKQRHLQTGTRYKSVHLLLLGLLDLSDLIIVLGLPFSLLYMSPDAFIAILTTALFVYILKAIALWRFETIVGLKSRVWIYFFLEPILSLLNPLISIASQFGQPTEWTRKT